MESNVEAKISTSHIAAAICACLGLSFLFLTRVEKSLPRSYRAKSPLPSTPSTRLADTLEQAGCHMPIDPNCEACDVWYRCATPQEAS